MAGLAALALALCVALVDVAGGGARKSPRLRLAGPERDRGVHALVTRVGRLIAIRVRGG